MALTQLDSSQTNAFANTFIGMGRNRIINGDMNIDQANTSTDVTVNSTAVKYATDQFYGVGVASSGVFVLAQDATGPSGFQNSLRATCTTADASIGATDDYVIQNIIEGYKIRDFQQGSASAKSFTLSFWVKSSLTGTYSGAFANNGATRNYTFEYTINVANTWEYKTVTATGETTGTWNTTTGNGLVITWALAVGSNFQATAGSWGTTQVFGTANQVNFMSSNTSRTWAITGVQLEIGSVATPFEYRPYEIELMLCQRYYEKSLNPADKPGSALSTIFIAGAQVGATTYHYPVWFKVPKRVDPTITTYDGLGASGKISTTSTAGTTTDGRTATSGGVTRAFFIIIQSVAADPRASGAFVADARL